MSFRKVPPIPDIPEIERRILKLWEKGDFFRKLMKKNENSPKKFKFLDGPITANNPMGVHHAWGRTYKDLFQRYKAMQGYKQRFQNGFDCQGLWVEVEVERELGFTSKRDIEKFGIARFVEACKERVMKYSKIQTQQSIRLGQWMDWENSYYTMSDENNYTIWYFLKKCFDKGWIYKGRDVVPWCPRCGTALSEHEIVTEGYKELTHPGLFLQFPLLGTQNEYLLVWTTTPWTLTSNVAVAVHQDIMYLKVQKDNKIYYLAKNLLEKLTAPYSIISEISGKDLVGKPYKGPFDELPVQKNVIHKVLHWDGVSSAEGTGLVHIAPGCGKQDFLLGKELSLPNIAPLDEDGIFIEGFSYLTGKSVFEVQESIFEDLRKKGVLYKIEEYTHRYPVCWRCDSELVFRLVDEWYIKMDELRYRIMESAKKVRWIPEFGLGRELDWLRNMQDWLISKKRYWGLALPIYECSLCGNFEVIGSKEELRARAIKGWEEFEGNSPHRPWVDAVEIRCRTCWRPVRRISDVGNPWLDAGIVPFSTTHYLTNPGYWKDWFPFDFITESFPGQFRNWFYAILAMSTVLEGTNPVETVLGYALMKDEGGEDMHKSKGNVIRFDEAAEKMGADIMRWIFIAQTPENNLNFGYSAGKEVKRKFLTLWNVYSFFITYAEIDKFRPNPKSEICNPHSNLDRWIISRLNGLIKFVTEHFDNYDPSPVPRAIEEFVDDLSLWYVRRSRRRFWKSQNDEDKQMAYQTLYRCLVSLAKLLAPVIPFLSEELYQNLVRSVNPNAPESVHLTDFPQSLPQERDEELEKEMDLIRRLVYLGRAVREKRRIKVRQPISLLVISPDLAEIRSAVTKNGNLIIDELNVKSIEISEKIPEDYPLETDGTYTVGCDTRITEELKSEGMARELVHKIQSLRKSKGFELTDRIKVYYETTGVLKRVIDNYSGYIGQEVLATEFIATEGRKDLELQIENERIRLTLEKSSDEKVVTSVE